AENPVVKLLETPKTAALTSVQIRSISGSVARFGHSPTPAMGLQPVLDPVLDEGRMEESANAPAVLQAVIVAMSHPGESTDEKHADDDQDHSENWNSECHDRLLGVIILACRHALPAAPQAGIIGQMVDGRGHVRLPDPGCATPPARMRDAPRSTS